MNFPLLSVQSGWMHPLKQICDQYPDCRDETDESNRLCSIRYKTVSEKTKVYTNAIFPPTRTFWPCRIKGYVNENLILDTHKYFIYKEKLRNTKGPTGYHLHQVCDKQEYCENGEDEKDCDRHAKGTVATCLSPRTGQKIGLFIHHLCNGVKDCLHGHDEHFCDTFVVIPSVRCPRISTDIRSKSHKQYVGKHHIQNTINECLDEELVAYHFNVSANCTSKGQSIVCTSSIQLPDFPINTKSLEIMYLNIVLPMHQKLNNLVILKVQGCHLSLHNNNIFPPFLTRLYLTRNHIVSLDNDMFGNSSLIYFLDLSQNPLTLLPQDVFHTLHELQILSLADSHISVLASIQFKGNNKLRILNISNTLLSSFNLITIMGSLEELYTCIGTCIKLRHFQGFKRKFPSLKKLYGVPVDICCLFNIDCRGDILQELFAHCADLFLNNRMLYITYFSTLFISLFHVVSLVYNMKNKRADFLLRINSDLADFVLVMYLLFVLISKYRLHHEVEYVVISWKTSIWCRLLGSILLLFVFKCTISPM